MENAFILAAKSGADPDKIHQLRKQWRNLNQIVSLVEGRLLEILERMAAGGSAGATELKFQSDRLEALGQTIKLMEKMKNDSTRDPINSLESLKTQLKQIVSDRFDSAIAGAKPITPSTGKEFNLESSKLVLNSLRATNSERWMNDVVKWGVLDLNLQRRNGVDEEKLFAIKNDKMKIIIPMLEERVEREVWTEMSHDALEAESETLIQMASLPRKEVREMLNESEGFDIATSQVRPSLINSQSSSLSSQSHSVEGSVIEVPTLKSIESVQSDNCFEDNSRRGVTPEDDFS